MFCISLTMNNSKRVSDIFLLTLGGNEILNNVKLCNYGIDTRHLLPSAN